MFFLEGKIVLKVDRIGGLINMCLAMSEEY